MLEYDSRETNLFYYTEDGGESWKLMGTEGLLDRFNINDIQIFDRNTIYIGGQYYDSKKISRSDFIKTIDGGKTWKQISEPQNDFYCGFSTIEFIDKKNGWATGVYGKFYKTTDGGNSWAEILNLRELVVKPAKYIYWDLELFALDKNNLILFIRGLQFESKDGGYNWIEKTQTITEKFDVSILGNDTFIICGDDGLIKKSTDRGNYFESCLSSILDRFDFHFSSVSSFDRYHVYAVTTINETSYILSSDDGGWNWKEQQLDGLNGISFVYFKDKTTGWISNESNTYKTENGGKSWSDSEIPGLKKVKFINNNNGYSLGNDGNLYETKTGGKSWTLVRLGNASDFDISENGRIFVTEKKVAYASNKDGVFQTIFQINADADDDDEKISGIACKNSIEFAISTYRVHVWINRRGISEYTYYRNALYFIEDTVANIFTDHKYSFLIVQDYWVNLQYTGDEYGFAMKPRYSSEFSFSTNNLHSLETLNFNNPWATGWLEFAEINYCCL
jgi:photosystem II stability/assembly factor-like uncharacterized protein